MDKYFNFMSQIPDQIANDVEKHLGTDMAIFKPRTFIDGITINTVDYHIVILPEPPPDTYVNGKLQTFTKGKILAVNPGDSWFCPHGHNTKQYLSLLITPELVKRVAQEMGFSGNIRFLQLQNLYSSELMQTIRSFEKETRHPDKMPLILDCLGIQIVALLLREFKTNLKKYPVYSSDGDAYIELAIDYMQVFYSSNLTIADICQEINVSPFHFIRTFKQKTGMSPHQYLLRLRINKAKELLRLRQYSVAEAAMLCGFVNVSHFSSKFKDITGNTPSIYKKIYS